MKLRPVLLVALLVALSACSSIKKTQQNQVDNRLNNIVWSVVSYKGHALNEKDFANGLPRISFNMQDGRITGTDGCNSFMGLATYKDNTIKTGAIASTKMACPNTPVPGDFYAILGSNDLTWTLDYTNTLRLMAGGLEMMALKERE
jgi:heat shock protein HslJ